MKSQMTIGKKLFLSSGAALVLTMAVAFVALQSIGALGDSIHRLIHVEMKTQFLAGEVKNAVSDAISLERGIMVRAFMKDHATIQKYNGQFRETLVQYGKYLSEIAPMLDSEEARRMCEKLQTTQAGLTQNHEELLRLVDSGQTEAANKLFAERLIPMEAEAGETADRLMRAEGESTATVAKSTEASVAQSRWVTILMLGLSLLVAVVVVYIVRRINKDLRLAVSELSEGAVQTASAAMQVSSSSQSLAQGSSEQAASLEETSASSEEINSMARKNSENSRSAAELVTQSQQKFMEANRSLEHIVTAMGEINTQSDRISKIIKVIDEIAFQTNILALNAAVEAARAGEAGMGFAVVADEVRNLAQRCAQAAKDTAGLIEESITKSNEGSERLNLVATAVRSITESSDKVKTLVDDVKLGSGEQALRIEEVAKAINHMERLTQTTAAEAEENASAGQQLSAQSETLREVVERLQELVGK